MASSADFHEKPFDEGTETKLQIFELYAREWLPVFLARTAPLKREIHIFDFFAGPGADSVGNLGSPLRLLRQLASAQRQPGWPAVRVVAHFYDADPRKVASLRQAKLALVDQFGVDHVTDEVFSALVSAPTCDFLFFLSSWTLHRFRDHHAIKQKISRPDDHYHVHRAAVDYYRGLLPSSPYYLAPFSIRKESGIYGIIFGSAKPLGMDKFLQVAWKKDRISGEADFDIDRDNIQADQPKFDLDVFQPTKVFAFQRDLESLIRAGQISNENDVIQVCFRHGVTRQHATPVLAKLKESGVIALDWRVPDVQRWDSPRPISFRKG